jgi:hypothetical protein
MDSIAAAHSGHMGLPLGAAEIGAVLYGSQVRFLVFSYHSYRGNEPDCHTKSVYNATTSYERCSVTFLFASRLPQSVAS